MKILEAPTNEQIREEAINNVPLEHFNRKGSKNEGLRLITEEFMKLMFKYYPLFCEETRQINIQNLKEIKDYGYKSATKYIAGKMYEGTEGWSKDGHFKQKWIVPKQLLTFMTHIYKDFWADTNHKIRDKFMKGVLKGDDCHVLLEEVYKHYGTNIIKSVTAEDKAVLGIS